MKEERGASGKQGGKKWWKNAIARFGALRIGGVGDIMVDEYYRTKEVLLSPEAPVLDLRNPVLEERVLGGAGNTARNAAALGAEVSLISAVGSDERGRWLQEACKMEKGLRLVPVLLSAPTVTKKRFYDRGWQQIIRISQEPPPGDVTASCASSVAAHLENLLESGVRVFFAADYGKGVVTERVVQFFCEARKRKELLVVWDPKIANAKCYRAGMCTVMTPNLREARELASLLNFPAAPPADEEKLARILAKRFECDIAVTLGERGSYYYAREDQRGWHVPTASQQVFDVAGAGDTFVAVLALALAAGLTRRRAALLANAAGSVVVSKRGTAAANPEELAAAVERIVAAATSRV